MTLVDTHCHLDDSKYDQDREELITRAKAAGVALMVTIGTTVEDSRWNLEFCRGRKDVRPTVGMHPEFASGYHRERDLPAFEAMAQDPDTVAVGEVGLDYHRGDSNRQEQIALFGDMIRLSLKTELPLVVHQRQAEADTLAVLAEEGGGKWGGVFHCYAGSLETARAAIALGFDIAVGGILTFKNAQDLRDVVAAVPMERLVLETDAPWLAPQAMRGQRNEPAYMVEVAEAVAKLKGLSVEAVAQATTANARRLFKLGERIQA